MCRGPIVQGLWVLLLQYPAKIYLYLMNKFPFLLSMLLLVTLQVFAQSKATISGTITNPLTNEVHIALTSNPVVPQEQVLEADVQNGTFALEIPLAKPMVVELLHGDALVPVYLEPGFALQISFNGDKLPKALKYSGEGANENNYLAYYNTRFEEEPDYQVLPDNIKLEREEFVEFLEYRRTDQQKSLEKHAAKHSVTAGFKEYMNARITYSYAQDRLRYHPLREQVLQLQLTPPPAAYYAFLQELDLQQPANLRSATFVSFLHAYLNYKAKAAGFREGDALYYKQCYALAAELLQGQARQLAQAQVLKQAVQFGHQQHTEQLLQEFSAQRPGTEVMAYLQELRKRNSGPAVGGAAPEIRFSTLAGQQATLSDYKGKLVYLAFWRTNCGLCSIEQPHLQRLIQKLEGEQVVFLQVSLDEEEQKWRRMVQERELQGEHVYVAPGQQQQLAQQLDLKDGPAYFLLDAQGRFLSLKARHPNHPEAASDIVRHLQPKQASLR